MIHAILLKDVKYAVDIKLENDKEVTDKKLKEEQEEEDKYKKEYWKDDILKLVQDLKSNAKLTGYHGEIIIYEVSKTYEFVTETYKQKLKNKRSVEKMKEISAFMKKEAKELKEIDEILQNDPCLLDTEQRKIDRIMYFGEQTHKRLEELCEELEKEKAEEQQKETIQYLALRLVPRYEKIDSYKF